MLSSLYMFAFLFGITAIPIAGGFVPSSGHDNKKCHWWVGAETNFETKLQASPFGLDAKNRDGEAPLHQACRMTSPEAVVKLLLEHGADPNVQDLFGRTPLLINCDSVFRDEATVKLLLEHGANPTIADKSGNTPLHAAYHRPSIVKLLMQYGADPTVANKDGRTPLQKAFDMAIDNERYSYVVEALLSRQDDTPRS